MRKIWFFLKIKFNFYSLIALTSASEIQAKNAVTCEVCTLIVRAAEGLVQQNKTETEIIKFVEETSKGVSFFSNTFKLWQ